MKKTLIFLTLAIILFSCERNDMFDFADSGETKLNITSGNGQLILNWIPVSGAVAYQVWYFDIDDPVSAIQWSGNLTGTSETITGLANGVVTYVWLKVLYTAGGTAEIVASGSGTPSATSTTLPPPGTPVAIPVASMINLSWSAVPAATAYQVWYSTSPDSLTAIQHGVDLNITNYSVTGLTPATTYYFWIIAKNSTSISVFSPMGTGTTL